MKEDLVDMMPTRFERPTLESLTSPRPSKASMGNTTRQRGELLPTQFVGPKWKHGDRMSAAQHELEFKLLKKMQERLQYIRNPRFEDISTIQKRASLMPSRALLTSSKDIDVVVEPSVIRFASYQVGSVHETHVTLRNVSTVSRRLRLLPIESEYFSIDKVLFPSSNGYVAPGMHCRATIKFMPDSLGDYEAKLTVITDIRRYKVDIVAHRESPNLSLEPSIDLGKCLVGHKMRTVISVSNRGGDGTFVIMSKEQLVEHEERSSAAGGALSDTHAWLTTMACGTRSTTTTTSPPRATRQAGIEDYAIEGGAHVCFGDDDVFTVSPSCFHLRKGETTDILVDFEPTGTGSFEADVPILSDDCKVTHVVLHADAVNVTVRVADISDRRVVSASQDAAVEDVWFGDVSPYDAVARRVTVENTTPIDLPFQWRAYEVPLPGYRSIMQQSADDIDAGRVTKDGDVFRVVPSDGVLSAGASFDFDFYFSPNYAEAAGRAAPGAGHSYKQIMRMFVDTELGFGGCLIKQTDDMSRAITRRSLPVSSSCVDDDDDDDACPLPLHVPCVAVPVEGRGVHYDVHLSQSLVRFCGEVRVGELHSKTIHIVNESRVPASFSIPEDPTSEVQYSPRTGEVPAFGSVVVCITVSPNRARGRSGDKDRVSVVKRSIEISDGNVLSLVTTYSVAPLVLTFGEVMLNLDNIKLNRTKSTALYMRNDNAVAIDYYIRCDHPDVTIDENEATGTLPPNSDYETVNVTVFGHTVGTLEDVITVCVAMSEKDTDRGGDDNGGLSEQSVCDRCDNIQQMGLLATVFAPRLLLDRYVVDIGLTYVGEVRRRRVKIKNVAKVSSHYEWVVPETNRIREPGNEDDDGTGGSISGASVIECSPQHGYLLGGEVEELKLTVRAGSLCGVFEVPIECAIDETDQVLGIVLRMRVQPIEVRFSVLDAENRLNAFRRTTAGVVGSAESSSGVRIAETDERRGEGGDIAVDDDDEEEENTGDKATSLSASAKESGGNQSVAINFGSVCRVGERYEMYLAVENLTKVKTGLTLDLEDYGTAYPGTTSMLSNTKTMVSVSKATAALPTERLEASTASSMTLGMSNNNSRNTLSPSLRPLSKSLGTSRRTMTHHMQQQQQQSIRLGAAHERAAPFSCELGRSLMRHRVTRSDDCEALGDGKGLAIALCVLHEQDIVGLCDAEEANAPKGRGGDERELHELLPRRSVLVRLTCFCSMPGEYVTSLGVRVGNLPPIPVPIRIGVVGTPVELRRERRAVGGYSSLQSHRSFTSLSFGSAWARSRVSRSFHVANTSSFDLEVRFCLKYKQEVLATSGEKKLAVLKLNVIADDAQNGKSRGEKVQVKLKENIDEDVREFSVYPERLELLAGGEACVTAHFSSDEAGDFEATIFGEQRVINKNSQLKLKLWHNQEQLSEGDRVAESGDASGDSSAETAPDTDAKSDTVSLSGPSPPPAQISAIIMGGFHAYAGVPVRPLDTLKLDLHAMAVSQHLDVEDSLDFFTQSIHAIHHPSLLRRVTLTNNFSTAVTFALRVEGEFFSIDEAVASVEQRIRATSSTLVPGDPSQAGMLFELPPHQNVEVACRFRPSAVDGHNDYTVEGKLLVDFGGTLASVQTLPIRASVCHPALEVVGASVTDFGTVHCESSRTLTITLSNPTKADAMWRIVNSGEMTSSSHHQHNGSSSLTTTLMSESDDLGVSFGSGTGSSSAPGFSVWPSHGVVKGNSIYGQITTTSLKVTFRPSTTATTTKLLRVVVSKGRGCEIVLKGSGTYDERIEAIVL